MVRSKNVESSTCDCTFVISEGGVPEIQCPDPEAQAAALEALTRFPDLAIKVMPVLVDSESPASGGSLLVTDTNGADFEVESSFGFDDDGDDDDEEESDGDDE